MGKHSLKTRTSSRKFALAGATAIAAATIVVPAANAAPDSDWDRLAQCESGGDWSINTGNGYHGGLQFHPQTWLAYGGGEFAPTADQATREQQIVVGERTLAAAGWGQWPACSASLGLNSAATPRDTPGGGAALDKSTPEPTPPISEAVQGDVEPELYDQPVITADQLNTVANTTADTYVPAELRHFIPEDVASQVTIPAVGEVLPDEVDRDTLNTFLAEVESR